MFGFGGGGGGFRRDRSNREYDGGRGHGGAVGGMMQFGFDDDDDFGGGVGPGMWGEDEIMMYNQGGGPGNAEALKRQLVHQDFDQEFPDPFAAHAKPNPAVAAPNQIEVKSVKGLSRS